MSFQVASNTLKECFPSEVTAKHADDGAPLQITDVIKDLIDFKCIFDGHFDRVRRTQGIELEGWLKSFSLMNCQSNDNHK